MPLPRLLWLRAPCAEHSAHPGAPANPLRYPVLGTSWRVPSIGDCPAERLHHRIAGGESLSGLADSGGISMLDSIIFGRALALSRAWFSATMFAFCAYGGGGCGGSAAPRLGTAAA